jgi:hypothetical protein
LSLLLSPSSRHHRRCRCCNDFLFLAQNVNREDKLIKKIKTSTPVTTATTLSKTAPSVEDTVRKSNLSAMTVFRLIG